MARREGEIGVRTQLVVEVANRPGSVGRLFGALARRGINVDHIAGVAAGEVGIVVLTVSDNDAARDVLVSEGYGFTEAASLVVRVEDRPGALAEAMGILADAGINVSSILEVGRYLASVDIALTVDDLERAEAALSGTGVDLVAWRR